MSPAPHIAIQLLKALEDTKIPGTAHAEAFVRLIQILNRKELTDAECRLRNVMSRFLPREREELQKQFNAELRRQSWHGAPLDVSELDQTIIALEETPPVSRRVREWSKTVEPIAQGQPLPSSELPPSPPPQWRRYLLSGTRSGYGRFPKDHNRALEPVHIVIYERVDLPQGLEDRDFRVWSQSYDDQVDWSYSDGFVEVEDRKQYLFVEIGYRIEFLRSLLMGGHWGRVFTLTLLAPLGIPDIRRRAEEEELQRISGIPKFLLAE